MGIRGDERMTNELKSARDLRSEVREIVSSHNQTVLISGRSDLIDSLERFILSRDKLIEEAALRRAAAVCHDAGLECGISTEEAEWQAAGDGILLLISAPGALAEALRKARLEEAGWCLDHPCEVQGRVMTLRAERGTGK
jgi:hypothetical protein